jgi:hypothetical protein
MKDLGRGLLVLAIFQLLVGGALFAFTFELLLLVVVSGMGVLHLIMGLLILRNQGWVNYLVMAWSALLLATSCVGMQAEQQKTSSNPGGCLGWLLAGALFYYSAQNVSALRKARAAGQRVSGAQEKPGFPGIRSRGPSPGLLVMRLCGVLFWSHSSIDPAEWQQVAPPGIGFQALVPGTPRVEHTTQETPAGKVELHKFMVEPKGKKEMFLVLSIRYPEEVSRELDGPEKLLQIGRQDLLSASQGQLQSERPIVLNGWPGLELEVLPPKGAIIKARIYATKNQIFEAWVHVPKIRLRSEDVQKFLDSFQLLAEPEGAGGQAD